jgi:MFS family permease
VLPAAVVQEQPRQGMGMKSAPPDPPNHRDRTEPPVRRRDGITGNRDFLKLWAGESVSLIGTQVTMFALPLVGVLTLHAGVFQVGLLGAMRTIPTVVVSLFAGVWLDRRRRRPIMIACSLGNAVMIGLVPLSSAAGLLSMNLLYAVCIISGVLSVTFDVGVQAYVPGIVERRHLSASNGSLQTSYSVSLAAGPGLAGLLVGLITAPITMSVDAVSYLCSAIGLISIRKPEPAPSKPELHTSVRSAIAEGLRAVYGNRMLRTLLGLSATFNFAQSAFITIFMVYAVRNEHASPLRLGIVLAAIAVGATVGSMNSVRIAGYLGVGRTMLMGTAISTVAPLALLIPHSFNLPAVLFMSTTEFCYGFGVLVFNVHAITMRQVVTPDHLLGRMSASYRMVLVGTAPIGAILIGVLGSYAGVHTAFVAAVLAFLLGLLWVPFTPAYRLKAMPAAPDRDAAPPPEPAGPQPPAKEIVFVERQA